jgi:hypothetical protein
MNTLDIEKPWKYKNKWLVWPETVLDSITISDCNDTVNGICLSGKTIQECIDECNEFCTFGYHIQFENGNTLCAPIRTTINYQNPIHRLRRKSIYPELNNVKISTFVNVEYFTFPPEEANVVFFQDLMTITDSITGMSIGTENNENSGKRIQLVKEGENNVQITQAKISGSQIANSIPLRYGDSFQIAIPATSLLISVSPKNNLVWESLPNIFIYSTDESSFSLVPLDSTKNNGDIVTYGDIFAISKSSESSFVVLNTDYSHLQLKYDNLEKILNNKKFICTFTLTSKMLGYYCDGKICKPVPIKDIISSGMSGRYRGVTVGRNPSCWGVCNYLKLGTNSPIPFSTNPNSNANANANLNIVKSKRERYCKHKNLFTLLSIIFIFILSIIIIIIIIIR